MTMPRGVRACRLALAAALLLAPSLRAQTPALAWRAVGPPGDEVSALAVDPKSPKTLWAGTRVGLYKSTDGAATWTKSSKGLGDTAVQGLAVDPANSKTLYAAGWRGGLFKSVDAGATWKSLVPKKGLGYLDFAGQIEMRCVALDPSAPGHLMFGSLFKSADGGTTWTEINPPAYPSGSRDVQALAFDPRNGKTVWSADTGSLKRTTDFGATWRIVDFGVPEPASVRAVAVHPKDPNLVYVGTGYKGLFRTTDGGKTWASPESGLEEGAWISAIALDPTKESRLFVAASIKGGVFSVFRSEDGGVSFEDVGAELPWEKIGALALDPSDPKTLYVGSTFSGVQVTHDGGATWDEASRGLPIGGRTVTAVATSGNALFAATFGAVHRSDDGGATWRRLRSGFEKGVRIERLMATTGDPIFVVAASKELALRYSNDGGSGWDQPTRARGVRCLARDPKEPGTLYACVGEGGIFRIRYGGAFGRYGDEELTSTLDAIAVDPSNNQTLLAADSGTGLRRSTNGGKKWKDFNKGITKVKSSMTSFGEYRRFFAMEWDPADPKTLYGATEREGVWKSTDAGTTWKEAGTPDERLTTFAMDPGNPKRLVAGTEGKGVFLSTDGGASWANAGQGLPENDRKEKESVLGIAFGPGSRVYVALKNAGVYAAD